MNLSLSELIASVKEICSANDAGHRYDHIERVMRLAYEFADGEEEKADLYKITLIALLHEMDDYKFVENKKEAETLQTTWSVLTLMQMKESSIKELMDDIKTIGFNKRLDGIVPQTIEAKLVSDADMCDALGLTGILRTYAYSIDYDKPFFDRTIFPRESLTADEYREAPSSTSVNHIFEKILHLKDYMLTNKGKEEALKRHQTVVNFLHTYFEEQGASEWLEHLKKYE